MSSERICAAHMMISSFCILLCLNLDEIYKHKFIESSEHENVINGKCIKDCLISLYMDILIVLKQLFDSKIFFFSPNNPKLPKLCFSPEPEKTTHIKLICNQVIIPGILI